MGVITTPDCPWAASNNASFLNVLSGDSGTGSGTVDYEVAANTASAARTGTLTIAGLTFTVTQEGTSPLFLLSLEALSFTFREGASLPQDQLVSIFTNSPALAFTTEATTASGNWLSVNPANGTAPSTFFVAVDPTGLVPGSYQGEVTVTVPTADPSSRTVLVTLVVEAAGQADLAVEAADLTFSFGLGDEAKTTQITVFNQGSDALNFQATATTSSGGSWLRVSPASGSATLATPASVAVTADPSGLPPPVHIPAA
ncbi:MAG: BACON domain-containing carbohydrate-binding protein [Acidobacteria bacterium]|nr:BACON domain-containing carbohydrate-binding protein [Acidobacteriota bacterium]